MKKPQPLVNRAKLEKLIDRLDLDPDKKQNEYIKARWLTYVVWWDARSTDSKRMYYLLRSLVVVGGALLPALVGLRELNIWADRAWIISIATIIAVKPVKEELKQP